MFNDIRTLVAKCFLNLPHDFWADQLANQPGRQVTMTAHVLSSKQDLTAHVLSSKQDLRLSTCTWSITEAGRPGGRRGAVKAITILSMPCCPCQSTCPTFITISDVSIWTSMYMYSVETADNRRALLPGGYQWPVCLHSLLFALVSHTGSSRKNRERENSNGCSGLKLFHICWL